MIFRMYLARGFLLSQIKTSPVWKFISIYKRGLDSYFKINIVFDRTFPKLRYA